MRKILLFALLLTAAGVSRAQVTINKNGLLFLQPGSVLTVQGDFESAADIGGSGTVLLKGHSLQHIGMHGFTIPVLQLENSEDISLEGTVRIGNRFIFTNGKLILNESDLLLEPSANCIGYDRDRFFVSNGGGRLIKRALDGEPFTFPVGSAGDHYSPVTLTQGGVTHDIGVKVLAAVFSEGAEAASLTNDRVNLIWDVADITPGEDKLDMITEWSGNDEGKGFDRTHAAIVRYEDGKGWLNPTTIPGTGDIGPFTTSIYGVTGTGLFSVVAKKTAGGVARDISVFPNPATTGFNVWLHPNPVAPPGAKYMLRVLDLNGRQIAGRIVDNSTDGIYYFDLAGKNGVPAAGIYLLEVLRDGALVAAKTIVIAH